MKRERGVAEKCSRGEAQIVGEVAEPPAEPDVAHFFPDLCHAAKVESSLPASFRFRETGSDELAYAPINMVAEFAIELLLQVSQTEPIEYVPHYLPSSKIRRTAVVSRSQPSFSRCSCCRPARVSE